MELNSLKDLYMEELRDLYDAEKQLVEALPKVAKAASNAELKQAIQEHLTQTKGHVQRLERVFKNLGEKPSGKSCEAMEGLVAEGEDVVEAKGSAAARDAALIAAAQRVEHYEISGYGTVVAYARTLRRTQEADLLEETLEEEKNADELLNDIALETVNPQAAQGDGEQTRATDGESQSAEEQTYEELYRQARKRDIRGRSKMNKSQLAKAVQG